MHTDPSIGSSLQILRLQEQASKPAAEEAKAPREEDFNGDWGKFIAATGAAQSAGEAQAVPVAWLHTVVQNEDGEEDMALSFAPDNFPLMGEAPGFFQSIKHEPLYTHPAAPPSPAVERDERAETWKALYRKAVNCANGLTNYVEDRPELRRIERELTAIESAARAALEGEKP